MMPRSHQMLWLGWLLLAAAAADAALVQTPTPTTWPPELDSWRGADGKLRVCVTPWTPQVRCAANDTQEEYSGYQVEMWREVSRRVPWLIDNYTFACLREPELIADLTSPNGTCFAAPSGIDVSMHNYKLGLQFSWPTYRSGFKILVPRDADLFQGGHTFVVFSAFHVSVWFLLLGTGIIVGAVLWLTDKMTQRVTQASLDAAAKAGVARRASGAAGAGSFADPEAPPPGIANGRKCSLELPAQPPLGPGEAPQQQPRMIARMRTASIRRLQRMRGARWLPNLLELHVAGHSVTLRRLGDSTWSTVGSFVGMSDPPSIASLPGRIVLFAWGLLVLIMVAVFTANTSANLTAVQLRSQIQTRGDLRDKEVITWVEYTGTLRDYGVPSVGVPWSDSADEAAMLARLRNGSADALVQDKSFVEWVAATNCDLVAVPSSFHQWDMAIAYSSRLPLDIVRVIDDAMLLAQDQDSVLEKLQSAYIAIPNACRRDDAGPSQIRIKQIAGLWVLLALCVVASYLLLFLCYFGGRSSALCRQLVLLLLPPAHAASAAEPVRHAGGQV